HGDRSGRAFRGGIQPGPGVVAARLRPRAAAAGRAAAVQRGGHRGCQGRPRRRGAVKRLKSPLPVGATGLAVGLAACGMARELDRRVEERSGAARATVEATNAMPTGMKVLIHEEDRPYFGIRTITSKGDPLSRDLEGDLGVATNIARPMSLSQWAQH